MKLPLREQGTLLTGIRGCDLAPKVPCDIDERYGCSTGESSAERWLVAFLRFCVMNPADPREVGIPGSFFQPTPPPVWKPSQFGHYPLHWFTHVMHCFEVVAYRNPSDQIREEAWNIYSRMVKSLHLNAETYLEMVERLSEDRIANGTVVT